MLPCKVRSQERDAQCGALRWQKWVRNGVCCWLYLSSLVTAGRTAEVAPKEANSPILLHADPLSSREEMCDGTGREETSSSQL